MVVVYAEVPGAGEKTPAFTGSSRFKAAKVAEMKVKTILIRFWQRSGTISLLIRVTMESDRQNPGSGSAKEALRQGLGSGFFGLGSTVVRLRKG
jgi:hypothetical protein